MVDNLGAMASVVELRGARKRFGEVEAVKGVDLTIGAGELVALLGPNGAGKTTSIALMLGLRQPTGGQALLFGLEPNDRRARSRCGVMLQESGTTGMLTVRELVDLFRAYYPSPLPADRATVRQPLLHHAPALQPAGRTAQFGVGVVIIPIRARSEYQASAFGP